MDALAFNNFSFTYQDKRQVLDCVDMQVVEGDFAILVGDTGAGKTTLLRCAKREVAPAGKRAGSCWIFGCDAYEEGASLNVGYVFQEPEDQIVCDKVYREMAFGLENIGMSELDMGRRIAETASYFGMESWFSDDTAQLSGGRKQLLNLASVLAMRPKLLLADEPTSQLDPIAASSFLHALFRVNRELGITVVLATHSPEQLVPYATCVFELSDGRVNQVNLESFKFEEKPQSPLKKSDESSVSKSHSPDEAKPSFKEIHKRDKGSCAIELRNVHFKYSREDNWVLNGLSMKVKPGDVVSIIGGNGAGKTTLLKLMASILQPFRGKVINKIDGLQAFLPQDVRLMFECETVESEIRSWANKPISDDVFNSALAYFGLWGLRQVNPFDLSAGQRQCLALAKILVNRPKLLLLDEPSRGADAKTCLLIGQALRHAAALGASVVLATHDLAFASRVSDNVAMVFDGKLSSDGPAETFFSDTMFYKYRPCAFSELWDNTYRECESESLLVETKGLSDTKQPEHDALRWMAG